TVAMLRVVDEQAWSSDESIALVRMRRLDGSSLAQTRHDDVGSSPASEGGKGNAGSSEASGQPNGVRVQAAWLAQVDLDSSLVEVLIFPRNDGYDDVIVAVPCDITDRETHMMVVVSR